MNFMDFIEQEQKKLNLSMGVDDDGNDSKPTHGYDYDLIVIGGGSGGLSASKHAAEYYNKKVAVFDFVQPSPQGSTWGLGGTCVNVGCIPKKLMHTASLLGEKIEYDSKSFGWDLHSKTKPTHDWNKLVTNVDNYIGTLNQGYEDALKDKKVEYFNSYASFINDHTIEAVDSNGNKSKVSADKFLIATGGRPRYPSVSGATKYGISSDDLFSLKKSPGRTLVVGASYVALECAGFLTGFGYDTTVLIRSIPLRGFDKECAGIIVDAMKKRGTKFIEGFEVSSMDRAKSDGPITVTLTDDKDYDFDTVCFAVGRSPETQSLGLDKAGVKIHDRSHKIIVDKADTTNVPHIYSIGDVATNNVELTPAAIKAGIYLTDRLYDSSSTKLMDYKSIPTTIFTPVEYGCCGLTEEEAKRDLGFRASIFHSEYKPLEWMLPYEDGSRTGNCYMKVITDLSDSKRVVGFHIVGPNSGEITQSVAVAMKMGLKKADLDDTVGIHPTIAEELTTLDILKGSGKSAKKSGC